MSPRGTDASTSLSRALTILEAVARHRRPPGFAVLQRETGLPKSTLHRVLATLMAERLLEHRADEGGYRLGLRLAGLSLKAVHGLEIRDAVRPDIETLSATTGENVLVAQRDDTQLIYVDRIQSQQTLRMISQLGNQAPLHCTGLGKVLLAFLPADERTSVIARLPLPRFTERTLIEPTALEAELYRIREQGYAVDDREHQEEIHCIAMPIRDVNGRVTASISVSAPVFRVSRSKLEGWLDDLARTARQISHKLGWPGWDTP